MKWEQRRQLLLRSSVIATATLWPSFSRRRFRPCVPPPTSEEFVKLLEGRLRALARAHNRLMEGRWEGTVFENIARSQLAAHLTGGGQRLRLDGGPVGLPLDLVTPFGLVLHALATNAAK